MLVKLVGGLGNQMFIYAFAKNMSLKGYDILLDSTYYIETRSLHPQSNLHANNNDMRDTMGGGGGKHARFLELEFFNLTLSLCFDYNCITQYLLKHDVTLKYRQLRSYIRYATRKKYDRLYWNLHKKYKYLCDENGTADNAVTQNFIHNSFHPHAHPVGYFQNLLYFKDIDSIIREDFCLKIPLQPRNEAIKQRIVATKNSVFLHIRLGDYLDMAATDGGFVRLGKTYYQSAIHLIKQKLGQPHFFIFSNDIEWCATNICDLLDFGGCSVEFIKGNSESNAAEEMDLMRACKHAIIANSTFSWWAAYLIDNKEKCVIMPSQILNDTRKIPHANMIAASGWIIIDYVWGTHSIAQ